MKGSVSPLTPGHLYSKEQNRALRLIQAGRNVETSQNLLVLKRGLNINNSLHFARNKCTNICPRTSFVPRSEQFSESVARGKL